MPRNFVTKKLVVLPHSRTPVPSPRKRLELLPRSDTTWKDPRLKSFTEAPNDNNVASNTIEITMVRSNVSEVQVCWCSRYAQSGCRPTQLARPFARPVPKLPQARFGLLSRYDIAARI